MATAKVISVRDSEASGGQGDSSLKVAYILHRFPYLTETFIMREMYAMRKLGIDVSIFSLLAPQHSLVHDQAEELKAYAHFSPFMSWKVLWGQWYFLIRSPRRYLLSLIRTIWQTYREPRVLVRTLVLFPKTVYFAREMQRMGIQHIHAHFVWLEGLAAGVVKGLLDIPFTIHPHAFGLFGRDQIDVRRELENASKVVTISNYHRQYVADLCPRIEPDDIAVVYCGLEVDRLQPRLSPRRGGPIGILSVGRLMEKKGFEYLVDACAMLATHGVDFRCQIAGSGALEQPLRERIHNHGLSDHVTLLGSLDQNQLLSLYQQNDIFALPCVVAKSGDRDGIPVVLMEAMACELPVVTTAVAGIPDLVQDDVTGMLVEERNAGDLCKALLRLVDDSDLRQRLGRQGRRKILAQFEVNHNANLLAGIFRTVCVDNHVHNRCPAAFQLEGSNK